MEPHSNNLCTRVIRFCNRLTPGALRVLICLQDRRDETTVKKLSTNTENQQNHGCIMDPSFQTNLISTNLEDVKGARQTLLMKWFQQVKVCKQNVQGGKTNTGEQEDWINEKKVSNGWAGVGLNHTPMTSQGVFTCTGRNLSEIRFLFICCLVSHCTLLNN